MVSTATRLNHYEVLGLTPAASDGEIADAFARAMSMFRPHAVEDVARLSVAYATLRNPAKRRAYDDSLGLNPQPPPRRPPMPAIRFSGSARWDRLVRPAADTVPTPAPLPEPEAPVAQKPASSPAEPVREPAKRDRSGISPEPSPQPERRIRPSAQDEPKLPEFLAVRRASEDIEPDVGDRVIDWKLPAFAAGGLLVAAALAGAWAGLDAGDGGEQPAKRAASIALPPLKPLPGGLDKPPATRVDRVEDLPQRAAPVSIAARPIEQHRAAPPPTGSEERLAEISQSLESGYYDSPSMNRPDGQSATDAPPAAAATLPISNRTAARTIERIGYACGRIAATTPVEGEATGVYKVTCTSGQSYRAAPVNGRYRFKRWGSR
jgi:curved DNA-binding protein CbpA